MLHILLRHSKAMHFIMSLLKSQGHDAIFVMVDLGSKLAHMVLTCGTEFNWRLQGPFSIYGRSIISVQE